MRLRDKVTFAIICLLLVALSTLGALIAFTPDTVGSVVSLPSQVVAKQEATQQPTPTTTETPDETTTEAPETIGAPTLPEDLARVYAHSVDYRLLTTPPATGASYDEQGRIKTLTIAVDSAYTLPLSMQPNAAFDNYNVEPTSAAIPLCPYLYNSGLQPILRRCVETATDTQTPMMVRLMLDYAADTDKACAYLDVEAWSPEDHGQTLQFAVRLYDNNPTRQVDRTTLDWADKILETMGATTTELSSTTEG